MAAKLLNPIKIIAQTGKNHTGTVIFLHGSGDTGPGIQEWVHHQMKEFNFPHIKIIFPTAPYRPYTPLGGEPSNVWFDRADISKFVKEDLTSINEMAKELNNLFQTEVSSGISLNRIVLGGFSMGGAMSFHLGFRILPQVAGVFALSSFINDGSVIFEDLKKHNETLPPLFQWHGARDDLVPFEWGKESFESLEKLGVKGEFHTGKNALHEIKRECLIKLHSWIKDRIPES